MSDLYREDDTIAAIATPFGPGGIGIVRVSGSLATSLFRSVFRPAKPINQIAPNRLYYGWTVDPATGEAIDEVLAVLMRAPCSYTREDILEIQCHSGPAILHRILEMTLAQGARLAEPGEFTRRAFLNGRMDLTQAEAVVELVQARSEIQRKCALNLLRGTLAAHAEAIRKSIVEALAHIEVAIDFPEEAEELTSQADLSKRLKEQALRPLKNLITAYRRGRVYREGVQVIIVGRPNVGKSSLLNWLLQEERAIVTSVPGTTRDLIAEEIILEGVPVTLVDTAGIHPTSDPVEQVGIERVRRQLDLAHGVLWVIDLSEEVKEEDLQLGRELEGRNTLLVLNKRDLIPELSKHCSRAVTSICSALLREEIPWVAVSARTGEGLQELCTQIVARALGGPPVAPPSIVLTLHQRNCVEKTHRCLEQAIADLEKTVALELAAVDLQGALASLGELTGDEAGADVLDQVFERFCIGK